MAALFVSRIVFDVISCMEQILLPTNCATGINPDEQNT